MELKTLTLSEYDELLSLLNRAFSESHQHYEDFRSNFPRIFTNPTEQLMNNHIGAFENGKLVGTTAAYPVSYNICGKTLNVVASGNLAVDKSMRGQGIMTKLLDKEIELTKDFADIYYLHGSRLRYRLYGYESCGKQYYIQLTNRVMKNIPDKKYSFVDMYYSPEYAKPCNEISRAWDEFIYRTDEEFIPAITSGNKKAICILDENGEPAGYFSYNTTYFRADEFALKNKEDALYIFKAFSNYTGAATLTLRIPAFNTGFINYLINNAESASSDMPAHFKIANLKNVLDVMLNAKAKFNTLKDGVLTIATDISNGIKIEVKNNIPAVSYYDGKCDIELKGPEVYTFLFGGNERISCEFAVADNWFPLNLYIPYFT